MQAVQIMACGVGLVDDWLASFDVRISPFVNLKITLEEEEIVKLGKKNEEEYPFTADIFFQYMCVCR